jgi:hypothetical protein
MAEISNNVLAVLVVAAFVVVAASAAVNLFGNSITGFATSDTGNISLSINSTLAIQVDSGNSVISFGYCAPRGGVTYTCATNDAIECDNAALNCSGDTTTPQYVRVDNVGNVDASVTVVMSCSAANLIGGTSPLVQFQTTQCNGTNVTSWTNIPTGAPTTACANISYRGPGQFRLYANVSIPFNAVPSGSCSNNITTMTFAATQI